ncbi:NERD domain-containing protein [Virgibacillus alimentarius]|uniref:NERD domain-containing protein n=1 Tax=Virgibacillus alimentarius TaxID=698769 RepID=UPI0004930A94|nr:NERD domain-containing protein [Virgibacillus alimentarius]
MGVKKIAQLIKLRDYISRYERNIYRYPSRYIRLKQDNWRKLHQQWIDAHSNDMEEALDVHEDVESTLSKWMSWFTNRKVHEFEQKKEEIILPTSEKDLKRYFLTKLFPFQLKWASSTVTELSALAKRYYNDKLLMYFLQRFPDTYFIMYDTVFNIKKVPIDGDIIFISPIGIDVIYVLEHESQASIAASNERTWIINPEDSPVKILSPLITLKRTERIIKSILSKSEISFPITKIVLSRTNRIIDASHPYNTKIIGIDEYEDWFQKKRSLVSPLKNRQLKAAEVLLKYCQTNSVKRAEWDEDMKICTMNNERITNE